MSNLIECRVCFTKFEVRACRTGNGLFAIQNYGTNETIFLLLLCLPDAQPIHFVNHSCNPNAYLAGDKISALRPILRGSEITIDYDLFDLPADGWNFRCECAEAGCRGQIIRKFVEM